MTVQARIALLLTAVVVMLGLGGGPAVAAPGDGQAVKVYVVKTPESNGGQIDALPAIARRTLGDPGRATEIFTLNRGVPQADGGALTSAADLHPGWILRLPDDAAGPEVQLGRVGGGAPAPAAPGQFTWKVLLALAGALLLAVATLVVIFRRRIGRRVGSWVRRLTGPVRRVRYLKKQRRAQRRLRDAYAADRVSPDIARRAVGDLLAGAEGRTEVYAVTTGPSGVTAWLSAAGEPPGPWHEISPGRWGRPPTAGFAADEPARTPLVRVGATTDGSQLFVDVSWLDGVLAVDGDTEVATAALQALAGELAPSGIPVFEHVPAVRAGPGAVPETGTVLAAARQRTVTGMVVRRGPSAAEVAVLLELTADAAAGIGALVLGTVPAAHWQWTAQPGGLVHIPTLDVTVTVPA